jgi:short-subunit dehydrogenase
MAEKETVLITGASSGIGAELARLFARDGSDLVLVARSEAALAALARELEAKHGIRARVLPADLSRPEAPAEIFERVEAEGVQVDVLVNNAGIGARGPFAGLGLERQMAIVAVNVAAPTELARHFLPAMIQRRRGGVLNVASSAAFQAGPWMAVYYASKAYLLSLSEALARELAGTGVVVSCLAPGPTHSGFVEAAQMEGANLFRLGAMSAADVAAAGHRGFRRGRTLVIPGALNRLIPVAARISPRGLMGRVAGFLNK